MSGLASRADIILALLRKELKAYSRDTIYVLLTLLVLIAIPVVFRLMPGEVDETLTLAVSPPVTTLVEEGRSGLLSLGATDELLAGIEEADLAEEQEGLLLVEFEDSGQMKRAIEGTLEVWQTEAGGFVMRDTETGDEKPEAAKQIDVGVGIAFPRDFIVDAMTSAEDTTVTIYSSTSVPVEVRDTVRSFVRLNLLPLSGQQIPVKLPAEETIVLGQDRIGEQVTLRERMRPMLIFMILLMETFSMASLVSSEVLHKTVTAVMVTPARVSDFLLAKSIFGTLLSLSQALLLLLLMGGTTSQNCSLVLVTLILGAMMFTGIALFVGSAGKDFMGQLFYAMAVTVPLMVPAFAILSPGLVAIWVRLLPSHPLIDTLVNAFNYGASWSDSWQSLLYAAGWVALLFGAGIFALHRKVESL